MQIYKVTIRATVGDKKVMANYLPVVLKGAAQTWFIGMAANSLKTWEQLEDVFITNFLGTYDRLGRDWDLYRNQRHRNEMLHEYVKPFLQTRNNIPNCPDSTVMAAFMKGVTNKDFIGKVIRKRPRDARQLFEIAEGYMAAKEVVLQ